MKTSSPTTRRAIAPLLVSLLMLVSSTAWAGWEEGVAAFQAKDFQQAVMELEKAASQKPDEWQTHYLLALSFGAQGDKDQSFHHLRKAYDLNPNDLSVKTAMSKLASASGKRLQRASAELGRTWLDSMGTGAR